MTITTQAAVLRAAVGAAVARACPAASDSQVGDITRRIIADADDAPEIIESGANIGALRWASGSDLNTLLDALRVQAPHLFNTAGAPAQAEAAAASRAKLKAMNPGARLEAANAQGVTGAWVSQFRKGGAK
ncbi:hypothetical protein [Brevundimonas guildfordensis]|uniref:Uncharacterized protein n=1 Tax=Brevundimonas guildfordensis TaxID=2762241 RepID=A0ABR8QZF7_9CAUL|nr:hypothetical protein [Brevundimonas guildfordensis]MBD7940905.1 hypothetical protein [Brevundimonas guildfordensis]